MLKKLNIIINNKNNNLCMLFCYHYTNYYYKVSEI